MTYKFTNSAQKAIEISNNIAISLGHNYIGTEHILYGLAKENIGVASKVLANQSITPDAILEQIEDLIGKESNKIKQTLGFTPRTKRILENAYREARKLDSNYIGTEHLLIGIMREVDSIAIRILLNLGVNSQKLYNEIVKVIDETEEESKVKSENSKKMKGSYNQTPTLNQFGVDLTKLAGEGKLDAVIGRKNEIERVIQVLSRRTKNNPCLIGEPGVGKTAIVQGLAQKIIDEDIPEILKEKRVVSLDITSIIAGAKYRGDFEERIKKCLNEVRKVGDIILFIDEIHNIVGAGAAEGAIDAANILKPILARGEIQLIGATTLDEYRKYIEKDAALERRFSKIIVDEPSILDTIEIIKGLRDKYEAHHNVKINDDVIKEAVNLSVRYINDRFLPDKAIDLIDEAASRIRMKTYTEPEHIKKLEDEIQEVSNEKEEAIKLQNFEKAASLRDIEKIKTEELISKKENWNFSNKKSVTILTLEDIAEVIASWTGIPVKKINENENEKLKNLEKELQKRVIGQEEAIVAVSKAIRRSRVGLKDPKRPIGSFLFLGPTGVGKTELAKALAESLFGNENSIIRIDMSEYMEAHSISKLIGSPPGYIGFDDGGQLTEKIRRKPYSIILFDEIEKAHPDVMNILLQILEDGRLTDAQGKTVNFKECVIIMTSNIGAKLITNKNILGFSSYSDNEIERQSQQYEENKKQVLSELKKELKPEFINRIDEIVVFHKLTQAELIKIVDIIINNLSLRLNSKKIKIELENNLKQYIAKAGFSDTYGARPLRRVVQNLIEDKITEEILNGNVQEGDNIKLLLDNNKVIIEKC